jgi:ribonuclease-3
MAGWAKALTDGPEVEVLRHRIGHEFTNPALLVQALAHRSWCAEQSTVDQSPPPSNERLEYLGDAVLGAIVADHVYRSYPDLPEGELTEARKSVVNAMALAGVAARLGIGPALLLGRGETAAGGREKTSILSDALEAVIAAVYLDGGWDAARRLVLDEMRDDIAASVSGVGGTDFKSRLQELAGRQGLGPPRYDVSETGPDHAKVFTARVLIGLAELGEGEGRSKKQAEQAAARVAVDGLRVPTEEHLADHA